MKYNIFKEYKSEKWYNKIRDYIQVKYHRLSSEAYDSFYYVEPTKDNKKVYSHKMISIIIESSMTFESTLKAIIVESNNGYNQDIHGYLKLLRDNDPDFEELEVGFMNREGSFGLAPFKKMSQEDQRPKWWEVYTLLKHDEIRNFKEGTLENALNTLAATAILHHKIALKGGGEGIFYNIGIIDRSRPLLF